MQSNIASLEQLFSHNGLGNGNIPKIHLLLADILTGRAIGGEKKVDLGIFEKLRK